MWDFSWYTLTLSGEPYHDLSARFREAVERGYNTIRICAMPFMLFTDKGKREGPLQFGNLGEVGQRTRWYYCRGGAELDGHAHLLALFREAKEHAVGMAKGIAETDTPALKGCSPSHQRLGEHPLLVQF